MQGYVETRLSEVRAILAAVVLIAEDGEAEVNAESLAELRRIGEYCERIAARFPVTGPLRAPKESEGK